MLSKVISCSLLGLEPRVIIVETDLSNGFPGFQVVGLPDASVRESKERIRAAIRNSGFKFPVKKITINLSPADTRKEGTHFDLPIAMGILNANDDLICNRLAESCAFFGELSLDGKIRSIKGALPLVIGLRNKGIRNIVLPTGNAEEASLIDQVDIYAVSTLAQARALFSREQKPEPYRPSGKKNIIKINDQIDYSDVAGQESVKRALQIAGAGLHNILMTGPPGSGKTMMATRLSGILPPMTYEEKLEVTKIFSIAGELVKNTPVVESRPFRAPHHTISPTALIGGGHGLKPGEITLAHLGVLFFDELPEFDRKILEALRQPMEDESVTISRNSGIVQYPSKFLFAASMNPCPCGYYGDPGHECTCSASQIKRYRARISGPLLERIDIHIDVVPPDFTELGNNMPNTSSADMKVAVEAAQTMQRRRYRNESILYNSQLSSGLIKKYCKLDNETHSLMEEAFTRLSLSARAYSKIIRLSRTIADMELSEEIKAPHIAEAITYRDIDRRN